MSTMSSNSNSYFGSETPGVQMLKKVWAISEVKPNIEIKGEINTDIYGTGGHNLTVPRRRKSKTF